MSTRCMHAKRSKSLSPNEITCVRATSPGFPPKTRLSVTIHGCPLNGNPTFLPNKGFRQIANCNMVSLESSSHVLFQTKNIKIENEDG